MKGNELRLSCGLSFEDFSKLSHLHDKGDIHVRISVTYGVRVGFISFDDIDLDRTLEPYQQKTDQLAIIW